MVCAPAGVVCAAALAGPHADVGGLTALLAPTLLPALALVVEPVFAAMATACAAVAVRQERPEGR